MFQKCQVCGVVPFDVFPILSICCIRQGLSTPKHSYTHPNPKNIHTLHPYVHNHLLQVSQDNSGQKQTPTKTNRHQSTPTDGPRQPKMLFKDAWRLLLTSNGICWCLLVSFGVRRRLSVSYGVWRFEEGVWGASERVSVCCLWTCLRFGFDRGSIWVFRPCLVQLALYWKIFERQNSTHLAFLKQQNTKTSLYKLSKNHRVITLLENFGSVRRNLQSTVSLDHPVLVTKFVLLVKLSKLLRFCLRFPRWFGALFCSFPKGQIIV